MIYMQHFRPFYELCVMIVVIVAVIVLSGLEETCAYGCRVYTANRVCNANVQQGIVRFKK